MNEKNSKWKVFVVAFVLVFAGFAAMIATPTVLAQNPTVTTEPAEDITAHTAVLNMSFDMDGAEEVTVWFAGNETGGDLNNTVGEATYGPGNTTHETEVEGLTPNTTYDFEAYLEYNETVIDGGIETFTTSQQADIDGPDATPVDTEVTYEANVTDASNVVSYSWTIIDGEDEITGTGDTITHTFYNISDANSVTLEIEDTNGNNDTATMEVMVYYTFQLTVEDSETGDPIEGAEAFLDFGFEETYNETTDASGIANFTGLIGDSFSLRIEIYEYDDLYGEEYEGIINATDAPGGFLEDTQQLTPRENFTVTVGSVTNYYEGYDLEGANVTLTDQNMTDGVFSAETDELGNAYVTVSENPYDTSFNLTVSFENYRTYESEIVESNEYGSIQLVPGFIRLGPVNDYYTGDTIEGAHVVFNDTDTGEEYTGETDGFGMADVIIPEGATSFNVTVSMENYEAHEGEFVLNDTHEYKTVVLMEKIFRIGPVVDAETGEPISGVDLVIEHGSDRYENQTDALGEFTLQLPDSVTNLEEQTFGVSFQKYEYESLADTYNYPSTGEIELTPKDEFAVFIGPVVEEYEGDYQGLQDVEVTLNHDDIDPLTDTTDFDGEIIFYVDIDPREETFELEASLEGYQDITMSFTGTESGRIVMTETPPEYYEVTIGPVRDQDGKMVSEAEVTLYDDNGMSLGSENTDEFGEATFDELTIDPEGTTFEYMITKAGYEDIDDGTFTGASSGEIEMIREEEQPVEEAEFEVTDFNVDPTSGEAPLEVTITANIENVGGEEGTIRLFVGGNVVNSWTIAAGDTVSVDETYEIEDSGTFNVELGDQRTTSPVEVEGEGEEEATGLSTAMLAGIGLIVIIIIIIIAVMMMMKGGREQDEEFEEDEELFEEEEFGEEDELFEEEDEFGEEDELFEEEDEFGEEEEFGEEDEELFEEEDEFGEEDELFEEEEEFGEEDEELFEEEE